MKSSMAAAILAIAFTTLTAAMPAVNYSLVAPEPDAAQVSQVCIDFKSSIPWHYTLAGPWGSGTAAGPSDGSVCVPTASSGGAMFIGPDANPEGGSTKLECYFPTSGQANCDVSLVDGYSLSLACTADGVSNTIGGGIDLYTAGNACPDQSGPNCINQQGYAASQSDVAPFFQAGVNNGNNYCIWVNCGQDYFFPVGNSITCTVSGTAK